MKKMFTSIFVVLFSFALMGNSNEQFSYQYELENYEYYEMFYPDTIVYSEYTLVEKLANRLDVNPDTLWELMFFETAGTMNPLASNPNSSAKGLIQFTDATARAIKNSKGRYYNSSKHLIESCSSFECQTEVPSSRNRYGGPVYQYLRRFKSLDTKQKLYMAVFHPESMNKDMNHKFSKRITKANPGIETVGDYIKQAEDRMKEARTTEYYD